METVHGGRRGGRGRSRSSSQVGGDDGAGGPHSNKPTLGQFDADLDFLHELMKEDVVRDSDVKDIVGDGIRFLNEKQAESENAMRRAQQMQLMDSSGNGEGGGVGEGGGDEMLASKAGRRQRGRPKKSPLENTTRAPGGFLDAAPR